MLTNNDFDNKLLTHTNNSDNEVTDAEKTQTKNDSLFKQTKSEPDVNANSAVAEPDSDSDLDDQSDGQLTDSDNEST